MKKWTSAEIRQLRLRLGWSQAELARRLGCRQQTVSEWETDAYVPQNAYSRLLELLHDHLEVHSDQVSRRPVAEILMKEVGYSQISGDELSEKLTDDRHTFVPKFDPQVD
ncbi:MAG TPA: helix-turn-helix transcriptional regulator [Bdellovibrionales bacterium]|nr:helix-turn-helix transcriptional regulator [Bdellovibrionales bacterium]